MIVYGVSVGIVGKWGKMCWDEGRCGKEWGSPHTLLHLSLHPRHSPDTSPHTRPTPLPHIYLTRYSTLTSYLRTLFHTPHTFPHLSLPPSSPHSLRTLPHNPHTFSNTSPYFIIYPMPKFLTFLIYCQIDLTIK